MPDTLDPAVADAIEHIQALGVPEWHALSVESCRRIEDDVFSEGAGEPPVAQTRELSIDGPAGDIRLRLYWPDLRDDLPVLVYFHGGGWVVGTLDGVDDICRRLAVEGDCLVVSVDYHLAPEYRFPTQVEEAHTVVDWVAATAGDLMGDPSRVAVAGTSAGANLATVAALLARKRDGPPIQFQLLLYPITNHDFETDSYTENASGYLLSQESMRWFWGHYLRSEVDGANPFASPLRADDLSGLPSATVVTAGFDPLRDEGAAYADRLAADSVSVTHRHYERMCHGFLSWTGEVDVADEAMSAVTADVHDALH